MAIESTLAITSLACCLLVFSILRILHQVFLHPLSKFPGPKAAAVSTWWKTYIEVIREESFSDTLCWLHQQYGEIVRVGPNELHFSDSLAYHDIYSSRWDKEKSFYESFGADSSSFGLLKNDDAKQRKDILQPMFSRRSIISIYDIVRGNVESLTSALAQNYSDGKSSDMLFAFRCFALDNITEFCFGLSIDAVGTPDFKAPAVEAMNNAVPSFILLKHFPLLRRLVLTLPPWLAKKASPNTAGLTNLQELVDAQVGKVLSNRSALSDCPTLFHRLLDPTAQKGYALPNENSLREEAQTIMLAGGVTVADTLMTGIFHILNQPSLHLELQAELKLAWPNLTTIPRYVTLEALPLLTATIKEILRIAPGSTCAFPRVVPSSGAKIAGHSIPAHTTVGMAAMFVHRSSKIFPDPDKFDVDRWLHEDAKAQEHWLVAFGKGSRSCLGINLAWMEIYVALATLLRVFEMEIDGTVESDLIWRDCVTPHYLGRHLRVLCKPSSE